jgi:hypothetical protein
MRQLNNKHLDTTEGASAHQGEIVSSQFAPSCQKDENQMKTYSITINEEEKRLLEYFMEKHLSIFNNLMKVRDNKRDKKEKFLRENILISLRSARSLQGGK